MTVDDTTLWFGAPETTEQRRNTLTRQRVVAEALALIAQEGVHALTMRAVAARLDVVPGALYRHVPNKERLHDLVLDSVLTEVDREVDPELPWTEQVTVLAHRLRAVLAAHPGIAGLLATRDPLGPGSLALAEAFLRVVRAAGFPDDKAGHAYFLVVGYVLGFETGNTPTSANQQRVQDPVTRRELHRFFRSLPADRFPTLVALGHHVWLDNRDERFTAGLDVLVDGLNRRTAPRPTGT